MDLIKLEGYNDLGWSLKKKLKKKIKKIKKTVKKPVKFSKKIYKKAVPKKLRQVVNTTTKTALKTAKIATPIIATSLGIPPQVVNAGLSLSENLAKGKISKNTFTQAVKQIGGQNMSAILKAKKLINNPVSLLKNKNTSPLMNKLKENYSSTFKNIQKIAAQKAVEKNIPVVQSVENIESSKAIPLYDRELIT